jgi:hypothetical protein
MGAGKTDDVEHRDYTLSNEFIREHLPCLVLGDTIGSYAAKKYRDYSIYYLYISTPPAPSHFGPITPTLPL